jgi:hypothetical protein
VVYIEEAHPIDAWQDDDNIKARIFLRSSHTSNERCMAAATCLSKLGIEFPAVVDDPANSVEQSYTAWPDRLYVIDRDGRIAYKSPPGPFGFHPDGVAQTLARLLPGSHVAAALSPRAQKHRG